MLNSSCPTTSEMAKLEDFAHLMVLGLGLSVPWCDDCTHRSSNADCISSFLLSSRVRSIPLYRLSCLYETVSLVYSTRGSTRGGNSFVQPEHRPGMWHPWAHHEK